MTDPNQQLSERELEILKLVATGASNKEIATRLIISVNTVKVHLRNIFSKIGVVSRTEAAMWAVQNGLVASPVQGQIATSEEANGSETQDQANGWDRWKWFVVAGISLLLLIMVSAGLVWNSQRQTNEIQTVQQFEQERWQSLAKMDTPRANFASAVVGGKICAFGGEINQGLTDSVACYSVEADAWESVSTLPEPLADIRAASVGGKIFIPGGRRASGSVSERMFFYEPDDDIWAEATPMPVALSAYALVAFEGKLYLFGGWDGTRFVDSVYEYDPALDVWLEKTPMAIARGFLGAAVSGGVIHLLGGYDGNKALDLHEAYSPERDQTGENPWESLTPLPAATYRFDAVSVAEIIHIFAGEGTDSEKARAYKYIPQQNEWQEFPIPIESSWHSLQATVLAEKVYLSGGKAGSDLTDRNMAYQAVYLVVLPVFP